MIDHALIEAFLNIAEYGNLTSAAAHMFTTQSSLSRQIKQLEEQVGTPLLIRRKGRPDTELTEAGKDFLDTAVKWRAIMREFAEVKYSEGVEEVSVGAPERVNSITLKEFYRSILADHPRIRLDIHTRHGKEIYPLMEARQLDLGIVTLDLPVTGIKSTFLCEEKLSAVVCGGDFTGSVDPAMLDPQKEIYSRWSDEFELWHDGIWPGKQYRIHVGTSTMIPDYLDVPGRWALIAESMTAGLRGLPGLSIHPLSVKTPASRLYLLEQKHIRKDREAVLRLVRSGIVKALAGRPV